ncbi:MAG TPA: M20/M25/M40 family metallo-hydrolase [Pyrinomonadaceae bacterium]|nr:M20/M25/M40 family metallo-hydrolase [Pyrinomonadaceae bacterium]
MDVLTLTRTLIDIPSVTGNEAEIGAFLVEHLKSSGYQVEIQSVATDRFNVIATLAGRPRVVFSTHMDTVPPFIASKDDAEFIYGRGACDAKGIIAAQICAAEKLRDQGFDEIGLLFTVDEELASLGAQVANNHSVAKHCEFMINGEPTDNLLAVGTKGSLRLTITAEGKSAHSAYPEAGESAIDRLLDVLQSVRQLAWPKDDFFGETTCNIGTISGGTRPNVIPSRASAELQIRVATSVESVRQLFEEAVGTRARITYSSAHDTVRLFSVPGLEHTVVRFTTDIPYLSNWGQPLLIGPGSILETHTDHERVSKRQLHEAVELYVCLGKKLSRSAG